MPTRPGDEPVPGEVTPGPEEPAPETPVPRAPTPAGPEAGMRRQDDRLTVRIWWELNRQRFLPPASKIALRPELTGLLLDAAKTESETVRERVLISLGRAGDERALGTLATAAEKGPPGVRLSAILGLGFQGDARASERLRKIAENGEAGVEERVFAVLALGLLRSAKNAAFIREVLDEEWEPNIRTAAALAAGLIRDPSTVEPLGRILLDIHPLRSPEMSRLGDSCTQAGLQCAAAQALGEILTPRAYDYLIEALEGGREEVRTAAAIVLSAAPGTAGLPALRRALGPESPLPVRQQALLGLCERGDQEAVEEARRILTSAPERDGLMGPFAALALGLARDATCADLLVKTLSHSEADRETRAAAALALGLGGHERAVKSLEKVVGSSTHPLLVGWGVIADAMLDGKLALSLAERILEESELAEPRRDAVTALRIRALATTMELLVTELGDSYHVNREAAVALAAVAPGRAARELAGKLADPNIYAARFAALALGVLVDPEPAGRLTHLLARSNVLALSPVLRACLYVENEYLFALLRKF